MSKSSRFPEKPHIHRWVVRPCSFLLEGLITAVLVAAAVMAIPLLFYYAAILLGTGL